VHKIKKVQQNASAPDLALLTARERKVLGEIVKGATSKEAAQTLGISRRTIEFHRANIREKIGVRTTVDLVRTVLGDSYIGRLAAGAIIGVLPIFKTAQTLLYQV
jgi:DNA-binding CsgD family transcriptional regulator